MIVNDFFTDTWTRGDAIITRDIVKLSRQYGVITGESDWAAPYYMGYIPWSKFPRHFTPFTVATNSNARTVTFHNLCVDKNIPWFYASWGGLYQNNVRLMEILKPDTPGSASTLWNNVRVRDGSYIQGDAGHGLINQLQIIKLTQGGQYRFGYYCFKVNLAGQVSDIYYKDNNVLNFTQLKDFFEGGSALTLEIQGGSTVDVHASDITDKGTLIYHGSDYKIVFLTSGLLLPANMMEAGEYNDFNLSVGFRLPVPDASGGNAFTSYYIPNGLCTTANEPHINLNENYQLSDSFRQSCVQIYDTNYFFGGLHGELSFDDFPSFPETSDQPDNYKWNDEKELLLTARFSGTYKNVDIRWSAPWRACYDFILMLNKHAENSNRKPPYSDTYSTTYPVSMFNSTDTPTGESVGEPYNRVEPKLREWQKAGKSISEDDFDVDNMPPDEPGGGGEDTPPDEPQDLPHDEGEPTDDQDSRTLTAPTCFLTQYAMGYSQLQTVGANLWQSWLTPDLETWKNFFFAFAQDTGTLDIGAALNFIISLRVFPFNLAGMTTDYISPTNGVYMGTGHTNFCPNASNLFRLNTVIGYLDCGTCQVVPETPYNDFRDMYNCSVLCFLPYCGTVELTPAEVIGRTLHVKYHIDFQSGACTALVKLVGDKGEYTVASKSGQIGFTLPVTATNAGQLSAQFAKDATQTMGTIGGFFFKAGHAQADNLNSLAEAFISKPKAINTDSDGNKSLNAFSNNTFETSTKIGEAGFNAGLSIANQALDMLSRSGIDVPAISGGMGAESMMQPDCCFVQIRRGRYAKPANYPHSQGYINGSSNTISYYKGMFTGTPSYPNSNNKGLCKFTGVDSTGLTCHEDERAEIIALLESGVYL